MLVWRFGHQKLKVVFGAVIFAHGVERDGELLADQRERRVGGENCAELLHGAGHVTFSTQDETLDKAGAVGCEWSAECGSVLQK